MRDEYLAHLQEDENTQFNNTIEQILYDSKFAGNWNDIVFYAGCVLQYSRFMEINFQREWYSAHGKYILSNILNNIEVIFARTDIKHIQDVESELNKSISSVIDNLKSNNLKYEQTTHIESLSFHYHEKRGEK